MPDRLQIQGRWYVAEDAIAAKPDDHEPWLKMRQLCEEYGVDPHRAYAAIRDGTLDARKPNGCARGYRCRRSEFARWYEEEMLAR